LFREFWNIQYKAHLVESDFEGSADILSRDRAPQNVIIKPIMPYTNVNIFREKGAKSLGTTEFYEKMGKK
jgi:hypothetical protein